MSEKRTQNPFEDLDHQTQEASGQRTTPPDEELPQYTPPSDARHAPLQGKIRENPTPPSEASRELETSGPSGHTSPQPPSQGGYYPPVAPGPQYSPQGTPGPSMVNMVLLRVSLTRRNNNHNMATHHPGPNILSKVHHSTVNMVQVQVNPTHRNRDRHMAIHPDPEDILPKTGCNNMAAILQLDQEIPTHHKGCRA
ncbi:hypothetical protein N7493_006149 [Penicillium malachiteum]|uniref:Uncharacterized protein n=1 Tax=Penicillium malachiteum TaxID=1324776 RepID=A0AAD6HKE0_9EURO|nr:hypothetical protein N7493_006149 [Penicillium malachiteum]